MCGKIWEPWRPHPLPPHGKQETVQTSQNKSQCRYSLTWSLSSKFKIKSNPKKICQKMIQFTSFKNVTKKSSSSRNGCIKSRGITWKVQEQSSKSNQQLKLFQLGKHVKMSKLVPLINALHSIA